MYHQLSVQCGLIKLHGWGKQFIRLLTQTTCIHISDSNIFGRNFAEVHTCKHQTCT